MRYPLLTFFLCLLLIPPVAQAQVLTAIEHKQGPYGLDADKGSAGLWFQLKKLNTTASAMHTTAHPDDEHAGLLTGLSRGQGVRTALLTINRGEAGANATGSELFDALGLVRTEELLVSGQYYGLDDQYFTTLTDYGYSKTLDEALKSWGREAVLEDMVRIIRVNRPLVVISRFHGSNRDGHGHHQAAGGITPEAFEAAGDPNRFPEQITNEGLRPWSPFKVFQGGVREQEPHHVAFDQSMYDPVLGDTYYNYGYYGLSLQRSQTSGRTRRSLQRSILYYNQLNTERSGVDNGFFEGMDTSISGMYSLFGEHASDEIASGLASLQASIEEAIAQFDIQHPTSSVPALTNALKGARALIEMDLHEEVAFLVEIKIEQIQEAINTALGIQLSALAIPEDAPVVASFWAPLPTLEGVVNGQSFNVEVEVGKGAEVPVYLTSLQFVGQSALKVSTDELDKTIDLNKAKEVVDALSFRIPVHVNATARPDRPYFYRPSIIQNQYSTAGDAPVFLPHSPPSLKAHATYEVNGVEVNVERTVRMRRSNLPYGYKS
ncbi:MAG: PIG-L family deacetylase, partial [Rhodothermaceae bacterium]|nr:PIG-L family deacetylase [Rhodothermaceae bacterium]